jgi:hypothetical protein
MKKTYQSKTGVQYTFPVFSADKKLTEWVNFRGAENLFETEIEWLQKAVETGSRFKNGEIGFAPWQAAPEKGGDAKQTAAPPKPAGGEYPGVRDINAAIEILVQAFGVERDMLQTIEGLKAAVKKFDVRFPNLKI